MGKKSKNELGKMNEYGLIGYPLSHSFSKNYFEEKFEREKITNASYSLFELISIEKFPQLIAQHPYLKGLNVTIPYKKTICSFLSKLDDSAQKITAVNVVACKKKELIGYNTDYLAFKKSLEKILKAAPYIKQALVFGSGGASLAVQTALQDLSILYRVVSRTESSTTVTYAHLSQTNFLQTHYLLINTTPLGMYPGTQTYPDIAYHHITPQHILYDLVYNPSETLFLKKGKEQGAIIKNGLEMFHTQAELSWQIWNLV